jgi:hypothetical protein
VERDVAVARILDAVVHASVAAVSAAAVWGEDSPWRAQLPQRKNMVSEKWLIALSRVAPAGHFGLPAEPAAAKGC